MKVAILEERLKQLLHSSYEKGYRDGAKEELRECIKAARTFSSEPMLKHLRERELMESCRVHARRNSHTRQMESPASKDG